MKPIACILLLLTLSGCGVSDWSRRDKRLLVFSSVGTGLDVATTDYAINHGFHEAGLPRHIIGEKPGTSKLILFGVGNQLIITWIADWLDEFRPWILGINGGVHTGAAVYNYSQIKEKK